MRHHWVHRRRQEGKCKQCGKVGIDFTETVGWFYSPCMDQKGGSLGASGPSLGNSNFLNLHGKITKNMPQTPHPLEKLLDLHMKHFFRILLS